MFFNLGEIRARTWLHSSDSFSCCTPYFQNIRWGFCIDLPMPVGLLHIQWQMMGQVFKNRFIHALSLLRYGSLRPWKAGVTIIIACSVVTSCLELEILVSLADWSAHNSPHPMCSGPELPPVDWMFRESPIGLEWWARQTVALDCWLTGDWEI